jgi:hypothetical protein
VQLRCGHWIAIIVCPCFLTICAIKLHIYIHAACSLSALFVREQVFDFQTSNASFKEIHDHRHQRDVITVKRASTRTWSSWDLRGGGTKSASTNWIGTSKNSLSLLTKVFQSRYVTQVICFIFLVKPALITLLSMSDTKRVLCIFSHCVAFALKKFRLSLVSISVSSNSTLHKGKITEN